MDGQFCLFISFYYLKETVVELKCRSVVDPWQTAAKENLCKGYVKCTTVTVYRLAGLSVSALLCNCK